MTNKISVQVNPEMLTNVLRCVADLKSLLPFLIVATKNERIKRQNIGQSGLSYGKNAYRIAIANPDAMKVSFKTDELGKDIDLFDLLTNIEYHLMPILQGINDSKVLVGQEIMDQANEIYGEIKSAARRDNKYKPASNELSDYYKRRNKREVVTPTSL